MCFYFFFSVNVCIFPILLFCVFLFLLSLDEKNKNIRRAKQTSSHPNSALVS